MRLSEDRTEIHRHGSKVVFSVRGCHTLAAAGESTKHLRMLAADIGGTFEFIADLSELTAFDGEARDIWQETFQELSPRIHLITLVKGTALARMTASAVGLYGGIPVRACETLEEALLVSPE